MRVGLTGGIGAGKSTVASRFVELGATLVDADLVAREVVQPGTPGLAEVLAAFGDRVLNPDGTLNRPALAAIVFDDPAARQRLNNIVHPLVGRRTAELVAAAPSDGILVQDIPLLVENRLGSAFQLVVVVDASVEERVRRLMAKRGMTVGEASARIATQAGEAARRAAADVWLDNSGSADEIRGAVDRLWRDRLVPFEENLRRGRGAAPMPLRLVEPDPDWSAQYRRLADRIGRAAGDAMLRIDHIGSTSVPSLSAKDVLDIQLGVASLGAADTLRPALREAGFSYCPHIQRDAPKPSDPNPAHWGKRFYTSADPGRPANLHVRVVDSPGWRFALLFRDWLRAERTAREEYLEVKRHLIREHADDPDTSRYAEAKEPWFDTAFELAQRWARATEWVTPRPEGITHLSATGSPKM